MVFLFFSPIFSGIEIPLLSSEEFNSLSPSEQCSYQCRLLRTALSTYLSQMSQQELHEELKSCLSSEVERVRELLNHNMDVAVLSRVVLQVILLFTF